MFQPLRETLASLGACDPADRVWELVVVDNGCDPTVRDLVELAKSNIPAPVRYVQEPKLGTSHARNRAVHEARAPVVLFTDDDVTFECDWLAKMVAAIDGHPECVFWGGRVEPVWPAGSAGPPAWFDPQRCPMLGDTIVQYRRGAEPRAWDPEHDPPFYTANLALRREDVQRVGYFDTTVGHRGGKRMGMEDSLMVKAIHAAGGRGWYAADAVVNHPVERNRVTRGYARSFAWRQGWLSVDIQQRESVDGKVPRWLYKLAGAQALRGTAQWVHGLVTFKPADAFAGQFDAVFALSKLWHAVTARPVSRADDGKQGGGVGAGSEPAAQQPTLNQGGRT